MKNAGICRSGQSAVLLAMFVVLIVAIGPAAGALTHSNYSGTRLLTVSQAHRRVRTSVAISGSATSGVSLTPGAGTSSASQPSSYPGRIIKTLSFGATDSSAPFPVPGAYDPYDGLIYSGAIQGSVNPSGFFNGMLEANATSAYLLSGDIPTLHQVTSAAWDTGTGNIILGENNATAYAFIQVYNTYANKTIATMSLPYPKYVANTLYDTINGQAYILQVLTTTAPESSVLTIYNVAQNLTNANPPSLSSIYAESMTFNSNFSTLFVLGLNLSSGNIAVLAINMNNYSEHLISMPSLGSFSTSNVALGGIAYDPADGSVYFSYSYINSSTPSTGPYPEGIGIINAYTQSYVLNFSMPDVHLSRFTFSNDLPAGSPFGPNVAGMLTYDPNNKDLYLTQNGLPWQLIDTSGIYQGQDMYNRTIAVINGTSPTSANPVALLASSSFPLGGLFIPSQPSSEGGSLWFPSIGLISSGIMVGNYTVAGIPPVINSFSLSKSTIDEGSSVSASSSVTFGVGSITYSYSGLPAGMVSQNSSTISGTPTESGTFTITLTVSDAAGETTDASVKLTVSPPLSASIAASSTTPDAGQVVQFSASIAGGTSPYSVQWSFGDGTGANGNPVSHVFSASGNYTVSATVTDSLGTVTRASITEIVSLPPENLTISASSNLTDAGIPVLFSAEFQHGSTPITYKWSLGDGSTSSSPTVTHAYSSSGNYTVSVTVMDSAGESSTASYLIVVMPDPQVSIFVSPSAVAAGGNVTLSASVTGGLSPYIYQWNLGDGNQSTQRSLGHTYIKAGNYNVSLKVIDAAGYTATNQTEVTVASGTLSIIASSNVTDASLPITFSARTEYGSTALTYAWSLGNGNTSSSAVVTQAYGSPGYYKVTLVVSNSSTQLASAAYLVLVLPDPQISINSASTVRAGNTVNFTVAVTGGESPYSYAWNLGDGNTSTQQSPQQSYSRPGNYTVTVSVTDAAGKTVTKSVNIKVTSSSTQAAKSNNQGSTASLLTAAAGGVAAGIVVGAVVIAAVMRRRKSPPGSG